MLELVEEKLCQWREERMVGEAQVPVLGWEDPLTSFDCLRRRIEDSSYENCSGIALNLQGL